MAKKKIRNKKEEMSKIQKNQKNDDSKLFAFLATFLSIIGFVIALVAKRDDRYVMYYANHSLIIFIISIASGIIKKLVGWIPITGQIISATLGIFVFVIWLLSWIFALSGKEKTIPIISNWAKKINL